MHPSCWVPTLSDPRAVQTATPPTPLLPARTPLEHLTWSSLYTPKRATPTCEPLLWGGMPPPNALLSARSAQGRRRAARRLYLVNLHVDSTLATQRPCWPCRMRSTATRRRACPACRVVLTPAGAQLVSMHGSGEDVVFIPRGTVLPGEYLITGGMITGTIPWIVTRAQAPSGSCLRCLRPGPPPCRRLHAAGLKGRAATVGSACYIASHMPPSALAEPSPPCRQGSSSLCSPPGLPCSGGLQRAVLLQAHG